MIYRRKVLSASALGKMVKAYKATFAALKEPRGAALLSSPVNKQEVTILLTQDYCDVFEQISPGGWKSIYDPDQSRLKILAGDPAVLDEASIN